MNHINQIDPMTSMDQFNMPQPRMFSTQGHRASLSEDQSPSKPQENSSNRSQNIDDPSLGIFPDTFDTPMQVDDIISTEYYT
jgi:hypothetical protein